MLNYIVCRGLKGSLERLQLDYVDIVFANKSDPRTPMEGLHIDIDLQRLLYRPDWVFFLVSEQNCPVSNSDS